MMIYEVSERHHSSARQAPPKTTCDYCAESSDKQLRVLFVLALISQARKVLIILPQHFVAQIPLFVKIYSVC